MVQAGVWEISTPWLEFGRISTWQHLPSSISVHRLPEVADGAWFCSCEAIGVRDMLLEAVDLEEAKEEAIAYFLRKTKQLRKELEQ